MQFQWVCIRKLTLYKLYYEMEDCVHAVCWSSNCIITFIKKRQNKLSDFSQRFKCLGFFCDLERGLRPKAKDKPRKLSGHLYNWELFGLCSGVIFEAPMFVGTQEMERCW